MSKSGKWALYEWFYPDIDREYFQTNEFQECLDSMNLDQVRRLTRIEWGQVRARMGKPRRLSQTFLRQERAKLNCNRINVRRIRIGKTPFLDQNVEPPRHLPVPLAVGSSVLAVYKHMLHRAVITNVNEDASVYTMRLDVDAAGNVLEMDMPDTDVMSLGSDRVYRVPPINNPPHHGHQGQTFSTPRGYGAAAGGGGVGSPRTPSRSAWPADGGGGVPRPGSVPRQHATTPASTRKPPHLNNNNNNNMPNATPQKSNNDKHLITIAILQRLLERKDALLSELQAMNNQAERTSALSSEGFAPEFQARYAWLIVKLDEANVDLEQLLTQLLQFARRAQGTDGHHHHHHDNGNVKANGSDAIINTTATATSTPAPISTPVLTPVTTLYSSNNNNNNSNGAHLQQDQNGTVPMDESSNYGIEVAPSDGKNHGSHHHHHNQHQQQQQQQDGPRSVSDEWRASVMANSAHNARSVVENEVMKLTAAREVSVEVGGINPEVKTVVYNNTPEVHDLIGNCIGLLFNMQAAASNLGGLPTAELAKLTDTSLSLLHPRTPENAHIYRDIEGTIGNLRGHLKIPF
eukprot:TRINITY_DN9271_c0_g1_i5.p1 TRINITY_DN9271_c0_g1~~TRINITY_DN9271_c0_g1_i5.p1  ORF type:complete len:626 (-),score=158.71 TRINITY_DN9271_c0_g1_i5:5-1729(-)